MVKHITINCMAEGGGLMGNSHTPRNSILILFMHAITP